ATAEEPVEPWTFQWSFNGADSSGGIGGHFRNAPREARTVMGGGKLYVPVGASGLFALNMSNGSQAWNMTTTTFNATPAYDPQTNSVFAGGANGTLYKINAS